MNSLCFIDSCILILKKCRVPFQDSPLLENNPAEKAETSGRDFLSQLINYLGREES